MRIVIWFQSPHFQILSFALGVLNRRYGTVSVLGLTNVPPSANLKNKSLGVVIDKSELRNLEYDIIIVSGQNSALEPVLGESFTLGLDPDKIVLDRTVCIPGFSMERYRKLRRSKLSILSQNCWGGLVYHSFGLQFLSPTINLYVTDRDFLRLLEDPKSSLNAELRFYSPNFDETSQRDYPVMTIGQSKLHMIHYDSAEAARRKWEDRRLRINWYNLLIMMYTENMLVLRQFDRLPFGKKVCFVPFETDIDCAFYIPPELVRGRSFFEAVNEIASNKIFYYDLWDLLFYGLRTPINVNP